MNDLSVILDSIKTRIQDREYAICLLSGGFDSFVLGYTIFKLASEFNPSCKVQLWSVPRSNRSEEHCNRINDWLKEKFPNVESEFKTLGNNELIEKVHHTQQVGFGVQIGIKQLRKIGIEKCAIFLGDTKNPDVDLGNPNIVHRKIVDPSLNNFIMQPFFYIDKSIVVLLAQELNILKEASEMTHSCSSVLQGRCNTCWQCRERLWAFNNVSLIDAGNN